MIYELMIIFQANPQLRPGRLPHHHRRDPPSGGGQGTGIGGNHCLYSFEFHAE